MLDLALTTLLSVVPPLVTAEGVTLQEDGKHPWKAPFVGVQVDVGAPDGLGASLVVTPIRFLRISVGGLTNGVGAGARAGLSLVAFPRSSFRPLIGVDGGYVFGNAGAWLPPLLTNKVWRNSVTGVNVGFLDAHVGFELGSKNVAFTLRAGPALVDVGPGAGNPKGIRIKGTLPSARLGLMVLFN
jgi:hypothetical protein